MINISKESEIYLKITGDIEDKVLISEHFSKFAKGYFFAPKYKMGYWDGKISFFSLATGLLPFGLYKELFDFIDKNDISYEIEDSLSIELNPQPITDLELCQEGINTETLTQRDYQLNGVAKALQFKRGLLLHPTGAGKTATLFLMINYLLKKGYKKILFIVPTKGLLAQTEAAFMSYGFDKSLIGKYFGDEKDDSKIITISTWQSASKNNKLLENVEIVLCDEVHGSKAKEISELMKKCINAEYRIGVTGTLPKKNEADYFTILGHFGSVLDTIKTNTLIHKEKVLSDLKIKIFNLEYAKDIKKSVKEYKDEKEIIKNHLPRKILVKSIINHYCKDSNTLILFDQIELGENYMEYCKEFTQDKTHHWISGKIKVDEREKIRLLVSKSKNTILWGTLGTLSTGIDIPCLDKIIFLFVGKSPIRVKQSIGRGLRTFAGKEGLTVFDIADSLRFGKKHLIERLEIYNSENFNVEVIEVPLKK